MKPDASHRSELLAALFDRSRAHQTEQLSEVTGGISLDGRGAERIRLRPGKAIHERPLQIVLFEEPYERVRSALACEVADPHPLHLDARLESTHARRIERSQPPVERAPLLVEVR